MFKILAPLRSYSCVSSTMGRALNNATKRGQYMLLSTNTVMVKQVLNLVVCEDI